MEGWGRSHWGVGRGGEDFSKARMSAASLANRTAGGGGGVCPYEQSPSASGTWLYQLSRGPGPRGCFTGRPEMLNQRSHSRQL